MAAERLYFDTNIFIRIFEGSDDDEIGAMLLAILSGSAGKGSDLKIVTSELTLAELLVKPLATDNHTLVDRYEELILPSNWLEVLTVDRNILRKAARLRSIRRAMRLPDAIHFSTALAASCNIFMTTDGGIHDLEGLSVATPHRAILERILASRP